MHSFIVSVIRRTAGDAVYAGKSHQGKRFAVRAAWIAVLLMFSGITGSDAQTGQTIYFMESVPQSSLLNPAYQHSHNFHFGFPMVSSFNVSAKTNFVNFNDLFFRHPQYDSLISFLHPDADINDFKGRLKRNNVAGADLHINLFSFGLRIDRSFISVNVSERSSARVVLPGDLFLLALEGNEQFAGETADFSRLGADLSYYREYAVGYSYGINDKLNAGIRTKLLFGKADFSFSGDNLSLYTDPETYNIRLRAGPSANMSLPVTIGFDEDGFIDYVDPHFNTQDYHPLDFVFNTGNMGFAVDLGATYRLLEPLTLSASITDLGFISWKQDVYNISFNGDYEFAGIDLTPGDDNDDPDPFDELLDTLGSVFTMSHSQDPYRRGLPARIYLGGRYDLHPLLSVGLMSRSEIYGGRFEQAVTLSANSAIGNILSASLSYSVMNHSYNNLGLGLAIRGGGLQLYMVSDNLMTSFIPHRTKGVNVWFGLNMMFGHKRPALE